jgi:hypothetical protein
MTYIKNKKASNGLGTSSIKKTIKYSLMEKDCSVLNAPYFFYIWMVDGFHKVSLVKIRKDIMQILC